MDTKLKYISLTVLVAVILTFIVVLGLIFSTAYLPSTIRKDETCMPNKDEEVVCGSTETIIPHYLDKLFFSTVDFPTFIKNNEICIPIEEGEEVECGSTEKLLSQCLDKIISRRYIKLKSEGKRRQQKYMKDKQEYLRSLDKSIWMDKPAARVTGKEQHEIRKNEGDASLEPLTDNEWTFGRENSSGFLRNGVRYRNGRLVVPVDGTYFVYSMVDFFETCDPFTGIPTGEDLHKPMKHAIYKYNILDTTEIEIISNVQPHQISSNKHYNSYSSYVSTITNLKAGDEISVKVSNITYIHHTKDNSFGLYVI